MNSKIMSLDKIRAIIDGIEKRREKSEWNRRCLNNLIIYDSHKKFIIKSEFLSLEYKF